MSYSRSESDIIRRINDKLKEKSCKIASIISACENSDKNRDGIIHVDDFEKAIFQVAGHDALSRRDLQFLNQQCIIDPKRKSIDYMKLQDILGAPGLISSKATILEKESDKENWFGITTQEETDFFNSLAEINHQIQGSTEKGTIGEFLNKASSPLEQANFLNFLQYLERFESESGISLKPSRNGFVIPLGPNLKANIQFNVSS